jgi:hypothetical protein
VKKVLEEVGLDSNIAQYNEMGGLSGGQKVKVVIAAALWNNPQVRFPSFSFPLNIRVHWNGSAPFGETIGPGTW